MAKFCTDAFCRDITILEVVGCVGLGAATDGYLPIGSLARLGAKSIIGRMVDQKKKNVLSHFLCNKY